MTDQLSDNLTEEVLHKNQTFACFPSAISAFDVPDHNNVKQQILSWMRTKDLNPDHGRRMISHNVVTVGNDNELLNDLPELKTILLDLVAKHNENAWSYASRFDIQESYLEIASEGAIYAPHEHSNALYSGTYFLNLDKKVHSPLKFRRHVVSTHFPALQIECSKETAFNQPECYVPHNEGTVLIYPPNLTHGYESNLGDNRITISFNVVPVGIT